MAHASISSDIVARYAADAALDVPGVRSLADGRLPTQRGVRVSEEEGRVVVELHLLLEWEASIPAVCRAVQARVRECLARMIDLEPSAVDVVVDGLG